MPQLGTFHMIYYYYINNHNFILHYSIKTIKVHLPYTPTPKMIKTQTCNNAWELKWMKICSPHLLPW